MKVLISQPRYMPSYEFVRRLSFVDTFVMMDQTKLDHREFQNRCKIRFEMEGPEGRKQIERWLTIPVEKGKLIRDTRITEDFEEKHEEIVKQYYGKREVVYRELVLPGHKNYLEFMWTHYHLIKERFGLSFELKLASDYCGPELSGKEEIAEILQKIGASDYYSGANCVNYGLNHEFLAEKGINLHLIDFKSHSEDILKSEGIDSTFSIIDQLNKGFLT